MAEKNISSIGSEFEKNTDQDAKKRCRICFDTEKDKFALIHPCKCSGSVKYVHQECLKSWILTRNEDLINRACEVCHTKFKVDYNIKSSFPVSKIHRESGICMITTLFIFYEMTLYELYMPYLSNSSDLPILYRILMALHLCFMLLGGAYYFIDAIGYFKNCILFKNKFWQIKNQKFPNENNDKKEKNTLFTDKKENSKVSR